jgi:hypothetical protein
MYLSDQKSSETEKMDFLTLAPALAAEAFCGIRSLSEGFSAGWLSLYFMVGLIYFSAGYSRLTLTFFNILPHIFKPLSYLFKLMDFNFNLVNFCIKKFQLFL